jgi:hypothetical protein
VSVQYPNVPALPGVPSLARLQTPAQVAAGATMVGENLALSQALGLPPGTVFGSSALYSGLALQPPSLASAGNIGSQGSLPGYGILLSNSDTAIEFDSAIELEVSADSSINTHPIEGGQFEAYNRIQQPVSIRLLLACQGKTMSYGAFLGALKALREGTQVVTISLPNDSYPNMVLRGFGYKRDSSHGAVTIWADTQWTEERSTNVVVTSPPTTAPQGEATTNIGSVSAGAPDVQQQAAISNPVPLPVELPQFTPGGLQQSFMTIGNGGMPPSGDAW